MLHPGLYEQLINRTLREELDISSEDYSNSKLYLPNYII